MCVVAVMAVQAVAGAYQAYTQVQAGKAQNSYYQYLADTSIAQGKAVQAQKDKQSELVQDKASQDVKQQAIEGMEFASKQKAMDIASGGGGTGSSQDIAIDTMNKQNLDEAMLRHNADIKSWELDTEGKYAMWEANSQANQYRFAGKQAKSAANKAAFSTVLSTAASIAGGGLLSGASSASKLGSGWSVAGQGSAPSNVMAFAKPF